MSNKDEHDTWYDENENQHEDRSEQPQPASQSATEPEQWVTEINNYLQHGGLFNPELATHENVRDLLRSIRDGLSDHIGKKAEANHVHDMAVLVKSHKKTWAELAAARAEVEELRKDKQYLMDKLKGQVIFDNDLRKLEESE